MAEDSPAPPLTLAGKLDLLFRTRHPSGRDEYTYEEVAEGIRQLGGPTIAITQLWQLRTGKQTNPRKSQLEAIAAFFKVPVSYFFEDNEETARLHARLELLAAMRNNDVERIALRAADLSPETLRAIAQIIEQARHVEGLPNGEGRDKGAPGKSASGTNESDQER
jgi:transcriptional regulator with XRE-family HTH domain